jgi:hypothetical protein
MHKHPGLVFPQSDINIIFETLIKVSCQYEESAEAFKIGPFYPHVFSDTDRPQGIWNYDPTSENDQVFQMCVSFEKKATEFNTCANSLKNKSLSEGSKEDEKFLSFTESKNSLQDGQIC